MTDQKLDDKGGKKQEEDKESETDAITICQWYTYHGVRCTKKSDSKKFCQKHELLKNDFKILPDNKEVLKELTCCNEKIIKIPKPRSKEHIISLMKLHKIISEDEEDIIDNVVEVLVSKDNIEEASIESDDYIELETDNAKYYYDDKVVRGRHKSKELTIMFTKYCDETPFIQICSEDVYCKTCYIQECKGASSLNQKIKYPNLKILV